MRRTTGLLVALTLMAWGVVPAVPLAAPAALAAEPELSTTLGNGQALPLTDIGGLGGLQYRNNNQRNFWWNAARQRWDGIMPTASPPAGGRSHWWLWHDLGGSSPAPVALAEDRTSMTPDAYWHEDTRMLYVFFSRGDSGTSRFRRYRYDPPTDRYVEQTPSGGVAAPAMLRGGARVTITLSPNGYLWAGVNYDNKLLISRSTDGGSTWPEPVAVKSTAIKGEGHWAVFVSGGSTRVGFAATEDGAAPGGNARVHFVHLDQDEPAWADPARWTDETSQLPGWEGGERADDELSAVTFENRVFIVIETEPLGDSRSNGRPQLIVFERKAGGGWLKHVILRFTSKGANDAKRPVVTVDAAGRLLIVTNGTTQRTHADLWYAPVDALESRNESWSKLRVFQVSNASKEDIYNTRLPLPRHPLTSDANLLVLIDDRGDALRMWRQVVRRTSGDPPADPTVAITQPAGGATVSGTVGVTATATNTVRVDFFAGSTSIGADTDGADGWSVTWNTTTVADGSHTLTARATSGSGVTVTSAPVQVTVNNQAQAPPQTLQIPVAIGDDDVEERANGRIWAYQSNLDFMNDVGSSGTDVQRAVGLRFTGVAVGRGATILAAHIQFQANKKTSETTNLVVTGRAADDAAAFTFVRDELTNLPRTSASVAWDPPAWLKKGDRTAAQRTADLAPVVQELVNRSGWNSGNAMTFVVEGAGERVAESRDGLFAPVLTVEFSGGS